MNRSNLIAAALLCGCLPFASVVSAQDARVSLDLITEPGISPEASREWLQMLGDLGFEGLRIRSARGGEKLEVQPSGSGFRVTGAITVDGKLQLPGGTYRRGDKAGVSKWLAKLRRGGEEELTTKTGAFGLLPRQLVEVNDTLAAKVRFSTADMRPREAIEKIADRVPWKLQIDKAADRALDTPETIKEDYIGLSSGTAMAAILRPLGLVLTLDRTERGEPYLRIADSRAAKEHWPIGWPTKKPPRETLPDLYKFINVEIKETPVAEALEAVRARLEVPLIVDQNSLARHSVDMATAKVTLPKANTFYSSILEKMLFQAKLKYELREDEAGQPFLWVTTLKQ